MSIIVNKDSKVLVQGFTGSEGTFHSEQMIEYGTNIVCGVTPGKGGTTHLNKPVYNSVQDALSNEDINTSIIFVPPAFAADAIMEAVDSNISTRSFSISTSALYRVISLTEFVFKILCSLLSFLITSLYFFS